MACAAITSNRLALFLFVKIHILSLNWCTHRGMGHEPLLRFRGLFPSAPAWGKVCFGSWPRAQGWPCVGFGLWHLLGLLGRAVCWHWPSAVCLAIFRAAGRVSDRVRQCVGEKQSTQLSKPLRNQRTCFINLRRP